jgi:hypothetical protein
MAHNRWDKEKSVITPARGGGGLWRQVLILWHTFILPKAGYCPHKTNTDRVRFHSNPKKNEMLFSQLQVTGGSRVTVPMRRAARPPCVCSGADVILSRPRRLPPVPGRVSSTRQWKRCRQSFWKKRLQGRWKEVSVDEVTEAHFSSFQNLYFQSPIYKYRMTNCGLKRRVDWYVVTDHS